MKNVTYINAGAGSGKTYTLTRILAEKLSEKDENGNPVIMPSQVILTTFTDLAAAEFREKARVQILENGNFKAASQMDSAAIGTVHSVALQFIKKFWYLLDYGADIKTISERDEDFYMSQSLARIVSEKDENGNNYIGETITPEADAEDGVLNGFTFSTYDFSDFVLKYTVDFTYVDEETGEERAISFPGRGEYALTEVLADLGIEGEISDVSLTIQEGTANDNALRLYKKDDAWYLSSNEAFTDIYILTVNTDDKLYLISVTDALGGASEIRISYFDLDGTTPTTPNFGKGYYLVVRDDYSGQKVIYYCSILGNLQTEIITSLIGESPVSTPIANIPYEIGDRYNFYIVKYNGPETVNAELLTNKWRSGEIEIINSEGSLGTYQFTIPTTATNSIFVIP